MKRSRMEVKLHTVSGGRACAITQLMPQPLHRAAEVLQQEEISLRTIARRMNVSANQARAELNPQRDLRLSDLYRWKSALKVPVVDLLVRPGTSLSESIQLRAKLLKMMKTVRSIEEKSDSEAIGHLTTRLNDQLTELMPELKDVSSWPSVGQRRTLDELGATIERVLPESFFNVSPSSCVND